MSFETKKHQTGDFGSSSLTFWSDSTLSWEESVERNHCSYLFEKRNGIEVVPYQDLEDGNIKKLARSRDARRKRISIWIILVFTAIALLSTGVYFGVQKSSRARKENSSANLKENANIRDWNPPRDGVEVQENDSNLPVSNTESGSQGRSNDADNIFSDNIFSDIPESNANSPESEEKELNPKEDEATSGSPDIPRTVAPEEIVVLSPSESLEAGQFRYSPNGRFKVGLTEDDGDFVLIKVRPLAELVIWAASRDTGSNWVSTLNPRCFMQTDGNFVLRDSETKESIWMTRTHGNPDAQMVLDNSGRLSVRSGDESRTALWMEGVPREQYTGPSSDDMIFPIRGAFYYPWYPSTWHVNGHRAHYDTSLGMYSSSDPEVARAHIDAMDYGRIQVSIASWWGPGTNLDRARMTMLMDETLAQKSPLKWTVYHEDERDYDQTPQELRKDFEYLKKWFAWHPAWAHIDGKPLIFVYNEAGCEVARRWVQASRGEWYVVLKLFSGFEDCPYQPDSWHQYGVGKEDGVVHNPGHSFVLSPGFWRADTEIPMLNRVNRTTFFQNTNKMVGSGEPWQLIVSFNEAGEGTLIEPSPDWKSESGFGDYLDCLHEIS